MNPASPSNEGRPLNLNRVKICGCTRPAQSELIAAMGFGAVGYVLHPSSPRSTTPCRAIAMAQALPPFTQAFAVVVNAPLSEIRAIHEACPRLRFQLHGDETPEFCRALRKERIPWLKALRIKEDFSEALFEAFDCNQFLLDAHSPKSYGGTGIRLNWHRLETFCANRQIIVAGGLNANNVEEAWKTCRPAGLDLSSSLESEPGVKSVRKLNALRDRLLNPSSTQKTFPENRPDAGK